MGGAGQHRCPGLGSTIGAPPFQRVMSSAGTDSDDRARALRLHHRDHGAHSVQNAPEVDIDCLSPCGGVCVCDPRDGFDHPSIADPRIQPAEAGKNGLDGGLNRPPVRHIAGQRYGIRADPFGNRGDIALAAGQKRHAPPCGRKDPRCCCPNSPACPCDGHHFLRHFPVSSRNTLSCYCREGKTESLDRF